MNVCDRAFSCHALYKFPYTRHYSKTINPKRRNEKVLLFFFTSLLYLLFARPLPAFDPFPSPFLFLLVPVSSPPFPSHRRCLWTGVDFFKVLRFSLLLRGPPPKEEWGSLSAWLVEHGKNFTGHYCTIFVRMWGNLLREMF